MAFPALDRASPFIGTWESNSTGRCAVVQEWKSDGTTTFKSGAATGSGRYWIAPSPDSNGFYQYRRQIDERSEGLDCSGSTGGSNPDITAYLVTNATLDKVMLCATPELVQCFGPWKRRKGAARE